MVDKLKRRLRGERGSVIPLVTILMFAMLGISAFAIDLGSLYQAKRQAQAAADAGALAGTQDLPNGPTTASTDATTYATKTYNGASAAVTTPYNSDSAQIHVVVTKTVPSILGSILGINSVTVTATATAKVLGTFTPTAIFAASTSCSGYGATFESNNAVVQGGVVSNGHVDFQGNNNTIGPITYGGPNGCSATNTTGNGNSFTSLTRDPSNHTWPLDYSTSFPACTYSGSSFSWSTTGVTIPSGVYCATGNISITGNSVTGNVTFRAASFTLSGNNANLTPYYNNLLIYQTGSSTLNITGNNLNGGHIFAPTATVIISGTNATTTGFIECLNFDSQASNFTFIGNGPSTGSSSKGALTQ
jgi:Flp pilus assembly protein TadG